MRAWPKGCNSWRDNNTPDGAHCRAMAESFVTGRHSYEKQRCDTDASFSGYREALA
jgi:hypothetical protein